MDTKKLDAHQLLNLELYWLRARFIFRGRILVSGAPPALQQADWPCLVSGKEAAKLLRYLAVSWLAQLPVASLSKLHPIETE